MKISERTESGLLRLFNEIIAQEFITNKILLSVHPNHKLSAANLYHYMIVRSNDLRKYHDELTENGLSGLRTSEGYIFRNLINIIRMVKLLNYGEQWNPELSFTGVGYMDGQKLLKTHTNRLFGKPQNNRKTRIMVTMPGTVVDEPEFVRELIKRGMEIARINMSHDDVATWQKIIDTVHIESALQNKKVKIFMDISGPKIRTGLIHPYGKKHKPKDFIPLKYGDHLVIHSQRKPATLAKYGKTGELLRPASISITDNRIFDFLKLGDKISFDDGKIEARVIHLHPDKAELIITNTKEKAFKLKSEKGVNLPDTRLTLPSLTNKDLDDLGFAAQHADILGYSFVKNVEDIEALREALQPYKKTPGIVIKIENKEAFHNLPSLLLDAMKFANVGVMIARGDLMVEIGEERIAEVQDQILWICEAAHIPVIWATQVFESLAKKGQASRAEITDAAKSTRAECVMLNKGQYIRKAVNKLADIISRMEKHTSKKKSKMRALNVATNNLIKIRESIISQINP